MDTRMGKIIVDTSQFDVPKERAAPVILYQIIEGRTVLTGRRAQDEAPESPAPQEG